MTEQHAYRTIGTVGPDGRLELALPLPEGTPVEVLVLTGTSEGAEDLLAACGSTHHFWDNPLDDEDWNAT